MTPSNLLLIIVVLRFFTTFRMTTILNRFLGCARNDSRQGNTEAQPGVNSRGLENWKEKGKGKGPPNALRGWRAKQY